MKFSLDFKRISPDGELAIMLILVVPFIEVIQGFHELSILKLFGNIVIAGSFRVSFVTDLGWTHDFETGWRGEFGTLGLL